MGFHAVVPTHEDLSIDVSITNVGLILTKPGLFLFSGYGQTDTVLESSYGNMDVIVIVKDVIAIVTDVLTYPEALLP